MTYPADGVGVIAVLGIYDEDLAVRDERMVIVCSECRRASCWHGEWLCEDARNASTVVVSTRVLDAEANEARHHYGVKKLREVYGE